MNINQDSIQSRMGWKVWNNVVRESKEEGDDAMSEGCWDRGREIGEGDRESDQSYCCVDVGEWRIGAR